MTLDLWEFVLGLVSLGVSIYLIQRKNIKAFQKLVDDTSSNTTEILAVKNDIKDINSRIEIIISDRTKIVQEAYSRLAEYERVNNEKMSGVYKTLNDNHQELMKAINDIAIKLNTVCTQFEEHRKTGNGSVTKKPKRVVKK